MASIQEVVNAAWRIKSSAEQVKSRSSTCAENLGRHSNQLAAVVRGSRTGEVAVQQVTLAQRAVATSAAKLGALISATDGFVADLTK